MSMSMLSERLGLPTWLVDIRHAATHQQLPSRSMLRLGAVTLLDYFRSAYWEPVHQIIEQEQNEIYQRLEDYEYQADQETLKRDKNLPTAAMTAAAAAAAATSSSTEDPDDYMSIPADEEKEEVKDNDDDEIDAMNLDIRIGTNINMFALLMDPPKKKKSKKKEPQQSASSKRKAAKKKAKKAKQQLAQELKEAQYPLPLDLLKPLAVAVLQTPGPMLWHCMVTHLVWGRNDTYEGGTLLQASDWRAERKYHTLLSTMGRQYPGLFQALLIHLVDYVLRGCMMAGPESMPSNIKSATVAVAWITHLLSRRFILSVAKKDSQWRPVQGNNNDPLASRAMLAQLGIPLRSLAQRCREFQSSCSAGNCSLAQRTVAQSLYDLFLQLLGEEEFFMDPIAMKTNDYPSVSLETNEVGSPEPDVDVKVKDATGGSSLSLEDMESLLAGEQAETADCPPEEPATARESSTVPTPPPRMVAWTRCTYWDPCPIGTLPGYPT